MLTFRLVAQQPTAYNIYYITVRWSSTLPQQCYTMHVNTRVLCFDCFVTDVPLLLKYNGYIYAAFLDNCQK